MLMEYSFHFLKHFPLKKLSQCIKIVKDVNQQPSNLSAVESLVV